MIFHTAVTLQCVSSFIHLRVEDWGLRIEDWGLGEKARRECQGSEGKDYLDQKTKQETIHTLMLISQQAG